MIEEIFNNISSVNDLHRLIDKVNDIDIIEENTGTISNRLILAKNFLYCILSSKLSDFSSQDSQTNLNLKHFFASQIVTGDRMLQILENFPGLNRNIGVIPSDFLRRVGKKRRKECIQKLYDLFAKYSLILNYDYECEPEDDDYIECKDYELASELTKLLRQKVQIKYVGHGVNGNGFRVTVNKKNYFYKVFFPHNKPDIEYIEAHGAEAEIPFAMFANKNGRCGEFAKFYFGRIATKYRRDTFMVTEFVERNKDYTKSPKLHIDYISINED